MRRTLFFCLLSLLLLGMQHEGHVHALSHFGPQLVRAHDTGIAPPGADGGCSECALLAAGAHAVTGGAALSSVAPQTYPPATSAFRSHATPAPVYFSSRAPPILL
ncbi:MAG TPA: hypothetical protein VIK97_04990 [Casimicrobiaceae bacterium]